MAASTGLDPVLAAKMHSATTSFHGWVYFAPEATEAYRTLGLTDRQTYFAPRAAPFGAVGPEVVEATFYNFAPTGVASAIPSAWTVASPDTIQQARFEAVAKRLEKVDADGPTIERALTLATTAVDALSWGARPLAAANASVPLPGDPLLALWQQITVLREWRGDAHIAVLAAEGVGPIECLVLHAATGQVAAHLLRDTRGWTHQEWATAIERLVERGWVNADGSFTAVGKGLREHIETRTDELSLASWEPLGQAGADDLRAILREMTPAIWEGVSLPG